MRDRRTGLLALALVLTAAPAGAEPLSLRVAEARQEFDARTAEPVVRIRLTSDSARDFARLTRENVGRTLTLKVDGQVVAAPTIREPIAAGSMELSGSLDLRRASELAVRLRDDNAAIVAEPVP